MPELTTRLSLTSAKEGKLDQFTHLLVLTLFFSIFFLDFLFKQGVGNRYLTWAPEILSLVATFIIFLQLARRSKINLSPRYVFVLVLLVLVVLGGIAINTISSGVIFAGIRNYFRYFPFFLLPALVNVSDVHLAKQLKVLLVLLLAQVPLALYQRFVQWAHVVSGDPVAGTLAISSVLSIMLISGIAIALSFYLSERLSLSKLLLITALLFIPTTLNETKGTFFLLPTAIVIITISSTLRGQAAKRILATAVIGSVLVAGFVFLYNKAPGADTTRSLQGFMNERMVEYLYRDSDGGNRFDKMRKEVGRVDSFVFPLKHLSDDVSQLMFGLGVGNASISFSRELTGHYAERYAIYAPKITALSTILWEVGVLGLLLWIALCLLIFLDARFLRRAGGITGALALGWLGIVVVYVVSLSYKNLLTVTVIGYLFWYFSGVVAARRFRCTLI